MSSSSSFTDFSRTNFRILEEELQNYKFVQDRFALKKEETQQCLQALIAAAAKQDRDEVRRLVSLGYSTNYNLCGSDINEMGKAIRLGDIGRVDELLSQGATPIRSTTEEAAGNPLEMAAACGQLEIVKLLWETAQNDERRYICQDINFYRNAYPPKGPLGELGSTAVTAAFKLFEKDSSKGLDIIDYLVTVCGATIDYNSISGRLLAERYDPDAVKLFDLVKDKQYQQALELVKQGVVCSIPMLEAFGIRFSALSLALIDRSFPEELITAMIQAGNDPNKGCFPILACCDDRPIRLLHSLGIKFDDDIVPSILRRPREGRVSGERVKILTELHRLGVTVRSKQVSHFDSQLIEELKTIGFVF